MFGRFGLRWVLLCALGAGLAAGSIGVRIVWANGTPGGKATLGYSEKAADAADVSSLPTAPVETVQLDDCLTLTGTLEADEQSKVASTADGIVQEVKVERGSLVKAGEVLVTVDPRDAQNLLATCLAGLEEIRAALGWDGVTPFRVEDQPAVRAAKAELELSQANWERYSGLQEKGAISALKGDQSRTDLEKAQQGYREAVQRTQQLYCSYKTALAKGEQLKKALDDTIIRAPFDGLVAEKHIAAGERVTTTPVGSGNTVATLVKINPLRLVLSVPQQYASVVRQGQAVKFEVESCPGRTFCGDVQFVGPAVERNSRSLLVEAIVDNSDLTLRPGLFATADLMLPEQKEAFSIPATAVVKMGEVSKVYTVRDGTIREKIVATGAIQGERIVVTAGLSADDVVVTEPQRVNLTGEAS